MARAEEEEEKEAALDSLNRLGWCFSCWTADQTGKTPSWLVEQYCHNMARAEEEEEKEAAFLAQQYFKIGMFKIILITMCLCGDGC